MFLGKGSLGIVGVGMHCGHVMSKNILLMGKPGSEFAKIISITQTMLVEHHDAGCEFTGRIIPVAFLEDHCCIREAATQEIDFDRRIYSARFVEKRHVSLLILKA